MGYTRYFTSNKTLTELPAPFVDDVNAIIAAAEERGIEVCGWDGTGKPEITSECINFNGSGDLSHENMFLGLGKNAGYQFPFCKTARKPYDAVVAAVLRSAKFHNVVTEYSSDGENEEDNVTALLNAAGCADRAA